MDDIDTGKVDIVVVYKIDRLTRSLADFSKMGEVFDRSGASFSAVSQQINSATSMGRLMLNVLLSFAQLEREVTGERIRDKFAASKAKGMWMGGVRPLGYKVVNRELVGNEAEAKTVRAMRRRFPELRSSTGLSKETGRCVATVRRNSPAALLRAMLFAPDEDRMIPTFTRKAGFLRNGLVACG